MKDALHVPGRRDDGARRAHVVALHAVQNLPRSDRCGMHARLFELGVRFQQPTSSERDVGSYDAAHDADGGVDNAKPDTGSRPEALFPSRRLPQQHASPSSTHVLAAAVVGYVP